MATLRVIWHRIMIDTWRRPAALLLIAGGIALLLWGSAHAIATAVLQRQYETTVESLRVSARADPHRAAPGTLLSGDPVGILEIPRIGLFGVVAEGDSTGILAHAIGHLPDTPLPWQRGNSALAAHRDALFRPLEDIRTGDRLRLRTPYGDFEYRVLETLIVAPEDLWVLDRTPVTMLTLISCYPFHYIGPAPERFVVRAERMP